MFLDSTYLQHNNFGSKVWIEKETQWWIQSNTGRQRVNINGVHNLFKKNVTHQDLSINAEVTKKLLQKFSSQNPHFNDIHIISDNGRYNKCKDVQAFLATRN